MILLASASPQRSALLAAAGLAFRVVPAPCDEAAILGPDPVATAEARARAKVAAAVIGERPVGPALVLGADTLVALGREIVGKPADRADAVRILSRLAGTTHRLVTAHAACLPGRPESLAMAVETVAITMRPLPRAAIEAYVATGESDGKAGAYALQEGADRFVERIDGDRDTVIGLHVDSVRRLWRQLVGGEPPRA